MCGCTDDSPCMVYDPALGFDRACYWVDDQDMCSACKDLDPIELLEQMLERAADRRKA